MSRPIFISCFLLLVFVGGLQLVETSSTRGQLGERTPSYNSIIGQLRDNWESPISYLKKRGYIPKEQSDFQKERRNAMRLNGMGPNYQFTFAPVENRYARDEAAVTAAPEPASESDKSSESAEKDAVKESAPETADESPGFLKSIKNKLMGLFGKKATDDATKTGFSDDVGTDFDLKNEIDTKDLLPFESLESDLDKAESKKFDKENDFGRDFLNHDFLNHNTDFSPQSMNHAVLSPGLSNRAARTHHSRHRGALNADLPNRVTPTNFAPIHAPLNEYGYSETANHHALNRDTLNRNLLDLDHRTLHHRRPLHFKPANDDPATRDALYKTNTRNRDQNRYYR